MTTVDKVTVSLPIELSAAIDRRRAESGESRSQVVVDLCRRGWWQWDDERRTRQSEAAYGAIPEAVGAQGWDAAAAGTTDGWDTWEGPEARQVIEDERAEIVEKVGRLAAEAGSMAFVSALRQIIEEAPARAAG
ncbi:MAG: hypothetical protein ABIS47_08455 [Acidimicrobiales bacterium]